eukprot:5894343-Pyramimonas_sp.AAC.1
MCTNSGLRVAFGPSLPTLSGVEGGLGERYIQPAVLWLEAALCHLLASSLRGASGPSYWVKGAPAAGHPSIQYLVTYLSSCVPSKEKLWDASIRTRRYPEKHGLSLLPHAALDFTLLFRAVLGSGKESRKELNAYGQSRVNGRARTSILE